MRRRKLPSNLGLSVSSKGEAPEFLEVKRIWCKLPKQLVTKLPVGKCDMAPCDDKV